MMSRLTQLFLGLGLFGFASALTIRARLGLSPWNVFHQGLARQTHLSFGTVVILSGAVVLLVWIPLRQTIGVGTIANLLTIGVSTDISLALIPGFNSLPLRWLFLVGGIVLTGVASGLYIGAGLEPGPRDGLMTGIVARTGWTVRATRTGIEAAVFAAGCTLGGDVGIGTMIYLISIGPLLHVLLPIFDRRLRQPSPAI